MKSCDIIGISDARELVVLPDVKAVIGQGRVFSGGKRHHEIVAPLLPEHAVWIDITVPLEAVFEQYGRYDHIVIFASGDPLFYGFAATVQRLCKDVQMRVFPSFNSLQMLAHRMCVPYHDMHVVSLTGRPWQKLDEALILGEAMIGCLTDRDKTPHSIHRRMVEYGYTNYVMTVGEHLGNADKERVSRYDEQAVYSHPNCIILEKVAERVRTFGLPDSSFALLNGREKMITKMPIRLLSLQALDLTNRHTLWDIGACTGSVSIEARLLFPHLCIHAFEIRPECEAIIQENARRHGAPGIELHMGDFLERMKNEESRFARNEEFNVPSIPESNFNSSFFTLHSSLKSEADNSSFPAPDAIFIGGHGGRLREVMAKACQYLLPGGVIVMNSVKAPKVLTDSHQLWDEACQELGLTQETPTRILLNDNHPIEILKCKK